ncbi:MAG: hypothetical protein ABIS06_02555 [Vicinamibacterales bacterium]
MIRYATLAYGDGDAVYAQASMLVISLLAHAPEPRELVVLTDRPERFEWLRDVARIEMLSASQLQSWSGSAPFSMRQKIAAAACILSGNGPLVLIDADVIATQPLQEFTGGLTAGARYMHKREFELGSNTRRGNVRLWRRLQARSFGRWQFRPADAMWNSGVIAVGPGDGGLLREALTLYDAIGGAGVRHFATEQLVVGVVLERAGNLHEARTWFTHYWGNKEIFTAEIEQRLHRARETGMTPAAAAAELRAKPIHLPAEVRPGKIEKLRRWMGV